MIRKTKINETQIRKNIQKNRKIEHTEMAEQEPSESAKWQMRHKPYQVGVLIREQGEQIRRESVDEFVARKRRKAVNEREAERSP